MSASDWWRIRAAQDFAKDVRAIRVALERIAESFEAKNDHLRKFVDERLTEVENFAPFTSTTARGDDADQRPGEAQADQA